MRLITCARCQQERPNYARGYCRSCYTVVNIASLPEKACTRCGQKDKKVRLGLCRKCYKQHWNEQNMAHVLEYTAAWVAEHPERRQASNRRYQQSLRGKRANLLKVRSRQARIKQAPGEGLTLAQWDQIVEEQQGRCYYCGEHSKMTMDHKVPLSRGGAHSPSNIVAACVTCNKRKGTQTTDEYLERLKGEAR